MSVAFQTYTTAGANFAGGTGNVSVSPPSGLTTDDLWVISSGVDTDAHPTNMVGLASGFAAVSNGVQTASGNWPQLRSQWKKAGASESAVNVPFGTGGSAWECQCLSMRFNGQDLTTPIGNTSVGGNAAGGVTPQTMTPAPLTIGANGSMVLEHIGFDQAGNTGTAIAPSSGYTEIAEFTPVSNNCKTGVAYKAVDAGTETPGSISCSVTSGNIVQLYSQVIEIKPAATGGGWNTTGTGPRSTPVGGAGPTGAGSSGAFTRSTASGALSATANQASEQDAAEAIAWAPKRRLANQASEQDTAQGITRRKTRAVAQASEQDAAQAVTSRKLKAVAQASESDSAQAIAVNPRRRLLAQSLEQDAAQAIAWRKLKAVAQASESDAAEAVAVNPRRRLIGQVNEQDASQAIAQRKARTLVQASEQDAAQAISSRKAKAIAQAQEQDSAQTVTGRKAATVGAAAESDAAGAITARKANPVAQASESDLAQTITPPGELFVSVAQASETNAAGSITSAKRASIGQASENDLAQTIAPPGEVTVAVGQASETDLAQSITAAKRLSLQAGSEQDAAGAITARRAFAVIGAAEQDQAQPITSGVTLVGQAFEQEAANDVTVAGVAPPAPVTQEPLGGYPIRGKSRRRRRAPPSVQPDLFELPPDPSPIRPAITKALAAASETDLAQPITVLHFPIGPVIAARHRARLIAEDDLLLMLCA